MNKLLSLNYVPFYAQSNQGWGEEGILFLKLEIKIPARLFCKRSRTTCKVIGMMQIKQANIQSADIYSVLQTWTACETKLVRFSLKCKLKNQSWDISRFWLFVFYRYTGIFYCVQRGSFYCWGSSWKCATNVTGKLKMLRKAQLFFLPKQN